MECPRGPGRKDGVARGRNVTDKPSVRSDLRLLGCVCKTCNNCCCKTRLVAPTKKPLERENKAHVVSDIAALNKTSKINQASARANRLQKIKEEASSSVCFGHMKKGSTPWKVCYP